MPTLPIAIVGAGIAGLTAALALSARGHRVDIVEQAPELSEVGAGLQLSPNATRILDRLGVLSRLGEGLHQPSEIALVCGRTLSRLARVPSGAFARQRWGAIYGVAHRADLQQALLGAVTKASSCRIVTGTRIVPGGAGSIAAQVAAASGVRPALVIGADGVWSAVRSAIPDTLPPRFTGQVAWRFQLPAEAVRGLVNPGNVTVFLGPSSHLVAYPLKGGTVVNLVAIGAGQNMGHVWDAREAASDRAGLIAAYSAWAPAIRSLLTRAPEMTRWPLFEVADGRFSNGQALALIGDAAHAMPPFAAQGAAMAIEDGFELATMIGDGSLPLADALARFEAARRPRIARARSRAAFNRFAYHARGPVRLGRDLVLSLRSPESLASDLDWLYGYRSPES